MKTKHIAICMFLAVLFAAVAVSAALVETEGDPYMGDWQGERTLDSGTVIPLVAQVMALGGGEYQANLLDAFDKRVAPLAVLPGKLDGQVVKFGGKVAGMEWEARLSDKAFSGTFKGTENGLFAMQHVVRLSPTSGEKPPAGAIVLFDGTNTAAWEHMDSARWIVDLKKAVGGDNCAAYIRTSIWSEKDQRVKLEMGSDDGLKAWVNGEQVAASNVARGLAAGSEKTFAKLKTGENVLLLKVTQGSGDWAACARLLPLMGDAIPGLKAGVTSAGQEKALPYDGKEFLLDWEAAGPYTKEGADAAVLFDAAFAPEEGGEATWKTLDLRGPIDRTCRWKILEDGSMQVFSGSIMTKQKFMSHKLHIEFRTPFMPKMRGQARGNSGVYVQGRYEVQVLDSYGLEGLDNECGGIYKNAKPDVNMCAPPLQWQTYDITFEAAKTDASGNVTQKARITVIHNGVTIHNNIEVETTPGGVDYNMAQPAPLSLQDHGNPVLYRNIWAVEQ